MKKNLYVGATVVMLKDKGSLYHKNQVGHIISQDTDGQFWVWFNGVKPTCFNNSNWPIGGGDAWCVGDLNMKNRAASI